MPELEEVKEKFDKLRKSVKFLTDRNIYLERELGLVRDDNHVLRRENNKLKEQ